MNYRRAYVFSAVCFAVAWAFAITACVAYGYGYQAGWHAIEIEANQD